MRHGEADGWPDKGIMTRKCRRWVDRCMVKSERKSGTHRVMAGPVLEWAGSLQMLGHCPHQSHRESNRSCRRCAVPLDRGTCSMRKEKKSQWDFFLTHKRICRPHPGFSIVESLQHGTTMLFPRVPRATRSRPREKDQNNVNDSRILISKLSQLRPQRRRSRGPASTCRFNAFFLPCVTFLSSPACPASD